MRRCTKVKIEIKHLLFSAVICSYENGIYLLANFHRSISQDTQFRFGFFVKIYAPDVLTSFYMDNL